MKMMNMIPMTPSIMFLVSRCKETDFLKNHEKKFPWDVNFMGYLLNLPNSALSTSAFGVLPLS